MIGFLSSNGEYRTNGMLLFSREQEATTQKGGERLVFLKTRVWKSRCVHGSLKSESSSKD